MRYEARGSGPLVAPQQTSRQFRTIQRHPRISEGIYDSLRLFLGDTEHIDPDSFNSAGLYPNATGQDKRFYQPIPNPFIMRYPAASSRGMSLTHSQHCSGLF